MSNIKQSLEKCALHCDVQYIHCSDLGQSGAVQKVFQLVLPLFDFDRMIGNNTDLELLSKSLNYVLLEAVRVFIALIYLRNDTVQKAAEKKKDLFCGHSPLVCTCVQRCICFVASIQTYYSTDIKQQNKGSYKYSGLSQYCTVYDST